MTQQQWNPQVIQQIKQAMTKVQMAQNPQLVLNQLLSNNPQLSSAFDLIRANGGNLQSTFYNLAKQKGVNPQDVLNLLK